jgi:hypothetical protein
MNLGKRLRKRYDHFISSKFLSTEVSQFLFFSTQLFQVFIRSSDYNRTLSSAYSNLIGFFGPGERGIDYPDIPGWPSGFVPVPVHTIPVEEDDALVRLLSRE